MQPRYGGMALAIVLAITVANCGDDEGVGSACSSADQCFLDLPEEVRGELFCLDRVRDGYCTHECVRDADCCAVEGECFTGTEQVCGPFESTGLRLCFLSCEGVEDGNAHCRQHGHPDFVCRSTGGGSMNRKVCVPGG